MDERDLGTLLAEHVDRHRVPGAVLYDMVWGLPRVTARDETQD